MSKLYDVHTVTPGTSVAGQFLLRAPLATLQTLWSMRPEAILRIEREAVAEQTCLLYDNNRGRFPSQTIAVTLVAVDELTIAAAVERFMDEALSNGHTNIDRMREYVEEIVENAIGDWQEGHVEATTDEEEGVAE